MIANEDALKDAFDREFLDPAEAAPEVDLDYYDPAEEDRWYQEEMT